MNSESDQEGVKYEFVHDPSSAAMTLGSGTGIVNQ
jgi:hypothetical protein